MKAYHQHTPRERLIDMAITRRALRGGDAHAIIESIVDECQKAKKRTMAAKMRDYYAGISQNALERLIKAVERGIK